MALVKICPSCGYKNQPGNSMCDICNADISGVTPVDEDAKAQKAPEAEQKSEPVVNSSSTVLERRNILKFAAADGSGSFSVSGEAVIGREGAGVEYLSSHMTVSRRHARLNYNGTWTIEDLNSSNGTYVNERRLEPGEKAQIKQGDRVSLSHSCTFNIIE